MTAQEVFEKAIRGVVAQGGICVKLVMAEDEDEWNPVYANEDGRCDPVGHVLKDIIGLLVLQELDYLPLYHVRKDGLLPLELRSHYGLLRSLQAAHDCGFADFIHKIYGPDAEHDARFLKRFLERCEAIAAEYGLTMPVLNEGGSFSIERKAV